MTTVNISEFKAKCLALLERLSRTGEGIVVTKRGRPIARVLPLSGEEQPYPQRSLRGTFEIVGDVVEPALSAESWEAVCAPRRRR